MVDFGTIFYFQHAGKAGLLFPNDLHQHILVPHPIKLAILDLLPQTEVQLLHHHRYHLTDQPWLLRYESALSSPVRWRQNGYCHGRGISILLDVRKIHWRTINNK